MKLHARCKASMIASLRGSSSSNRNFPMASFTLDLGSSWLDGACRKHSRVGVRMGGRRPPAGRRARAPDLAHLYCGLWAVGFGLWALGFGLWALGCGLWAVGCGLWAVGFGPSLSFSLCARFTVGALHCGARGRN